MLINGKEFVKAFIAYTDPALPGLQGEAPWIEIIERLPNGDIIGRIDNYLIGTEFHELDVDDVLEFTEGKDGRWLPIEEAESIH